MQLDPQQQKAVETISEKALVLAGAGSGKTRVLIERIAHLIENEKVSPFEIMVFTFTRKAAGEIRKRLEERIGSQAFNITMGTMHGVGLNMIQRFSEMVGLKRGKITVYSDWEVNYLLKDLAIEMGYHNGKTWKGIKKKDIDGLFNMFYQRGIWPLITAPGYELFEGFFARCRENNALTYGSILTTFKKLVPKIAHLLYYKHIMVDEVQDIDPLQWKITNELCESLGAALFVVGDIDQSIYSFRGADPDYLIRHEREFDIFRIEKNYRSAVAIVAGANNLIGMNKKRIEKTMIPNRVEINHTLVLSDHDSNAIIKTIEDMTTPMRELEDSVIPQNKIAVIARNHFLLKKLSTLMEEAGIDHDYAGKESELVHSEEFRRFHAFLKLIVNPYDNFSFLLIRELIGVSRDDHSHIRLQAAQEGKSHFQAWQAGDPNPNCPFQHYENKDFKGIIEHVAFWCQSIGGVDEISIFADVWYNSEPNINGITCDEGPIQNYLDWIATYDIQDEVKDANELEGVQLMTIHASKGLEFPVVIVAGCNEGILPSKHAAVNQDELESERRLAYVAWTRAEDQLILAIRPTEKEDARGNVHINPVSRFVAETGLLN